MRLVGIVCSGDGYRSSCSRGYSWRLMANHRRTVEKCGIGYSFNPSIDYNWKGSSVHLSGSVHNESFEGTALRVRCYTTGRYGSAREEPLCEQCGGRWKHRTTSKPTTRGTVNTVGPAMPGPLVVGACLTVTLPLTGSDEEPWFVCRQRNATRTVMSRLHQFVIAGRTICNAAQSTAR
jgi:hypothetical protein